MGGILGCIAGSMLICCCAPQGGSIQEGGKYTAVMVLSILCAVLDGISIIWNFVVMATIFASETGWGVFVLFIQAFAIASLCVHIMLAVKSSRAKQSLTVPVPQGTATAT